MADDSDVMVEDTPEEARGLSRGQRIVIVVGLIGVFFAVQLLTSGSDEEPEHSGEQAQAEQNNGERQQQSADDTTSFSPERIRALAGDDDQLAADLEGIFNISGPNTRGGIVAIDKRLEEQAQEIDKLERMLEETDKRTEQRIGKVSNEIDQKLDEIVGLVASDAVQKRRSQRRSVSGRDDDDMGELPPLDEVPSDGDSDNGRQADKDEEKVRFPYKRLTAMNPQPQNGDGGSGIQSPVPLTRPGSGDDSDRQNQGRQPPRLDEAEDQVRDDVRNAADTTKRMVQGKKVRYVNEEIPAFSYVRVANLHGVACPVSGGLRGNGGNSDRPFSEKMPITLAIDDSIRGPDGTHYSLGNAHIFGFCVGSVSKRPAAVIKVERLSYVDEAGESQYIPINGYIIDRRDNELGIAGYVDETSGSDLAAAALSAGVGAAANVAGQAQTDTFQNQNDGDVISSIPSGNAAGVAGARGFSAVANEIAEMYRRAAEQNLDVVRIESGLPGLFINTDPIEYQKVRDEEESHDRQGDPLL